MASPHELAAPPSKPSHSWKVSTWHLQWDFCLFRKSSCLYSQQQGYRNTRVKMKATADAERLATNRIMTGTCSKVSSTIRGNHAGRKGPEQPTNGTSTQPQRKCEMTVIECGCPPQMAIGVFLPIHFPFSYPHRIYRPAALICIVMIGLRACRMAF